MIYFIISLVISLILSFIFNIVFINWLPIKPIKRILKIVVFVFIFINVAKIINYVLSQGVNILW